MKQIYATIITIGDELLIGQVIDTNSAWIARQLNQCGIAVKKRVAVGDSSHDIVHELDAQSDGAEIILLTGGLGPTADDITKKVLCDYFRGKLVVNEAALAHVKYLFEKVFKRTVSEVNLKQAEVPDVCEVIQNKRGSAPGMIFRKNGVIYISMPGVPYEMKGMVTDSVIPLLINSFTLPFIVHKYMLTAGIGESALAEVIHDFETSLPAEIKLAYLPNYGMVRLRLSTTVLPGESEMKIENKFAELKGLVREYLVSDNDDTMPELIGKILKDKKETISTAESCTGGYIAHLLTSVPGSSAYYQGSVISYSNELKHDLLGVSKNTLESFGAVSEETVIKMLHGLLNQTNSTYGIATSGIMGPEGGTPDKPVGTVWIAAGNNTRHATQKLHLRFSRERNIEVASMMALNFLRKFILENRK